MPGIPKSRGCQVCKQRKIKCDETWPSCGQCKQRRINCPGPTQLVKFIHNDSYGENSDQLQASFSAVDTKSEKTGGASPSLRMRKVYYPKVGDNSAEYGLLLQVGFPRSNPTTLADRTGARLIAKMEHSPEGLISVHMSYLPELPKRLGGSPCLRDSVDLFCAAWSDSSRHRPQRELMEMPQYGKLLRSLRRALVASQACSTETLAAMTLLERTSKIFDRGRYADLHLKGIREALLRRGLPKLEDTLEIAVINEIHGLLLRDPERSQENEFIKASPWKEAFERCADVQSTASDVRPFLVNDMLFLYEYTKRLSPLFNDFRRIYADPFGQGMTRLATSIRQRLQDMKESTFQITTDPKEKGCSGRMINDTLDKDLIIGRKFYFKAVLLAAMYQRMLLSHLVPLHIVYEMSVVYGTPDPEIFAEFREASVGIWNVIPNLRVLQSIPRGSIVNKSCIDDQAVEHNEVCQVIKPIQETDSDAGWFPKDRKALNRAITEKNKVATSRRLVVGQHISIE